VALVYTPDTEKAAFVICVRPGRFLIPNMRPFSAQRHSDHAHCQFRSPRWRHSVMTSSGRGPRCTSDAWRSTACQMFSSSRSTSLCGPISRKIATNQVRG